MKIGVLGTGVVGQGIATALVEAGHEVAMGARAAGNENAVAWVQKSGDKASEGSFADAAAFGELVVNATAGVASLDALNAAGASNLSGKVLLDISNPLDFSRGMPPTLTVCNTDSLAEQIQRAFPEARVVKSLNTMNASVMTHPEMVPGNHAVFVSSDDDDAKSDVVSLLQEFGWKQSQVVDLGNLSTARGPEMYLALWVRLFGASGTPMLNIELRVAESG